MSSHVNISMKEWSNISVNYEDGVAEDAVIYEFAPPPASDASVICLSALFFAIGAVGVTGNSMVIVAIIGDSRMRGSVTNLFITNLAFSDLFIMIACVPDIVQFMDNKGWLLGLPLCKALRFTQVFSLYASVMTLVGVCVERYVAIVHPIQAHIVCCRQRILMVIATIWPLSMLAASPNLFLHQIIEVSPGFTPCIIQFPKETQYLAFKFSECAMFYVIPLILQATLYILIARQLFHGGGVMEPSAVGKEKFAGTMKARRGVVKMLIAGVTVYFVSFSPHQILLFYNTFSHTPIQGTWSFLIFVNIMAYASSAANPLLYSVFSHKFRQKFRSLLFPCLQRFRDTQVTPSGKSGSGNDDKNTAAAPRNTSASITYAGTRSRTLTKSIKTTVTEI